MFIDLAGLRTERRKWMNVVREDDQIDGVWYTVAINEYDKTCSEDRTTFRLDEAFAFV